VPHQGYGAPAPYAPNQRVNEAEAREQQLFLRDTDSGRLRAATVIETSFADLGLDSVPSTPPWTQAPFPSRGREPFRGSHGSYRGRPPVTPARYPEPLRSQCREPSRERGHYEYQGRDGPHGNYGNEGYDPSDQVYYQPPRRNDPSRSPAVGPYSGDPGQHWGQTYSSPLPTSPAASTSAADPSINPRAAADALPTSPSSSSLPPPPPPIGAPRPPNTASGRSNTPRSPKPTNQAALELAKVKWFLEGGSVTDIYIWRTPLTLSRSK
jgi:hypothetical protein